MDEQHQCSLRFLAYRRRWRKSRAFAKKIAKTLWLVLLLIPLVLYMVWQGLGAWAHGFYEIWSD
jgi:hypothetical protein